MVGEMMKILTFGVFFTNRKRQNEIVSLVAVQREREGLVGHGHVVPQHVGDGLHITLSFLSHGKQSCGIRTHDKWIPQQRTAQIHQLRAHSWKEHKLIQNQVLEAHRVWNIRVYKLRVDLAASREVLICCLRQHEAGWEYNLITRVGVDKH